MPIPRIDPVLHAWSQPYGGVPGLRVHAFSVGTISLPQAVVFAGGSWGKQIELDVSAFVIAHPTRGLIVFDTGFNDRVRDDAEAYLGVLLPALAEFEMDEGGGLASQMESVGLDPRAVTHVVLSHLHFDHAGAIGAFPNAVVVVARRELEAANAPGLLDSIALFPEDWAAVATWMEIDYDSGEPFATFTAHHDLLGDGSVVLVDLRGHTAGSQGAIVRTEHGPILLAGDAAPIEQSWKHAARPLLADDLETWWEQIWRIKKLIWLEPSTTVAPGHDLRSLAKARHPFVEIHRPRKGDGPETPTEGDQPPA